MVNRYIKVFDWYVIKKYLGTFVFTIAIFIVVIVVFDISEKLDNFLKGHATFGEIVVYYAGAIPFYIDMLFPLMNFLAVIFFTAKMANQTEIVPILSSGASFNRFLRPYAICATLIFVVALFADVYLIPFTNRLKTTFENQYNLVVEETHKEDVHIQLDKNTFVYMQSFVPEAHRGYQFVLEKFNGNEIKQKLTANSITYDSLKRVWSIHDYNVRYVNGLREKMISGGIKDTVLDMRPGDFVLHSNIYTSMSMSELNTNIQKEQLRSTGVLKDMLLVKYERFTHPMAAFVLTLIGVSLSSRKVRGGVGLPLGIGFFLCFAYIVVDRFADVFATKGGLPPILAVFITNVLFGLLGYYLLRKAPK